MMMGIKSNFYMNPGGNVDVIPVDIVSNGILVTTAYACTQEPQLHVYNIGSSFLNELIYEQFLAKAAKYLAYNPTAKAVGDPGFHHYKTDL